jgi:hypothetical protein
MAKKSKTESRKKRMFQGNALEKRIKTSQDKTKGYRSNVFKSDLDVAFYYPKDGSHIIDIIPYLAGKNDPATEEGNPTYTFEYQVHRVGPNNTEFICPRMYDKKCPVCEHREKLREKDDDNYKAYWPKVRNLYNIVSYDDKQETKKGVQIWDVSYHYFEKQLMAISRKPSRSGNEEKTINFVDPVNGKSISFTIEPAKGKDDYKKYVGHAFDDRDYEIDDKILDQAHALDELIQVASYEEIKAAMTAEDNSDKKSSKKNDKGKKKKDEPKMDKEELLEALDELDDMDELVEFAEEHDLEIDEDGKPKKEKKKLKKQIEDMDDEEEEDETEEEEDEEPEDEDEEEETEDEDIREELEEMSFKELKKYVKKNKLDIDLDDYDKDDKDDLIEEIISEME